MTQRSVLSLPSGVRLNQPQFHLDSYPLRILSYRQPKDQKDLYFDELTEDTRTAAAEQEKYVVSTIPGTVSSDCGVTCQLWVMNLGIIMADITALAKAVSSMTTNYHDAAAGGRCSGVE